MLSSDHGQFVAVASLFVPLVLAIVCHEMAHGLVARALGDPTAEEAGRLTFNPFAHVDPIGTIVLPGMLWLAHAPVFGWAKPVPVNKWRLRNPRRDMMLVGAAGPGSNLVLGVFASVAMGLLVRLNGMPDTMTLVPYFLWLNLTNFLALNLFLALFNLLPVPPFDGSHIVEGLLPEGLARVYDKLRRYSMLLMLALIVVLPMVAGVSVVERFVVPPFDFLLSHYLQLAAWVAGTTQGIGSA